MPTSDRRGLVFLLPTSSEPRTAVSPERQATQTCAACGRPVVRGSRAGALATTAGALEDNLCSHCIAADSQDDDGRVPVAVWNPADMRAHLVWMSADDYLDRNDTGRDRVRLIENQAFSEIVKDERE